MQTVELHATRDWSTALRKSLPFLLAITAVAGCTATDKPATKPGGTIVIATTSDADILFPPLVGSTTGRQVTELVYDYLTEVSPGLNTVDDNSFARRLARSWVWSADSMSLAVSLQPDARWHDGAPVHSDDVTFTYSVYTDSAVGSPMSSQLSGLDSVTALDSLTVIFWFNKRYPLQFYDATSQMQILPKHVFGRVRPGALREFAAATEPVGSGRYRFAGWKRGESIELTADTANYRGAPKIRRLIWRIMPSPVSAIRALFAGDADVFEGLRPEDVVEAASSGNVNVVMSPGADYVFMTFNLRDPDSPSMPHPLFGSRELRRALSMAVDRKSMVRNVFDSLAQPAIGPTIRSYPLTDSTIPQLPFDPRRAGQILDSLGWHVDPKTSIRMKNGQPLRFRIILPSTSLNRVRMGVLFQEQLRRIGVAVIPDEMDFQTFNSRLDKRNFDAALASWHLGTSPASIREIWTTAAAGKGGINYGSYSDPDFDRYVDSAVNAFDFATKKSFYTRAYEAAIADAPAIWLYEPKMVLGINTRIRTAPMRPDAWWFSMGDWHIPPDERIRRDSAG